MELLLAYLSYHWIGIFFAFFVVIALASTNRTQANISAWLLILVLDPFAGSILYLLVGTRKNRNLHAKGHIPFHRKTTKLDSNTTKIEKILLSNGMEEASSNNAFRLFTSCKERFDAISSAIKESNKSIHISLFLIKKDPITKEIIALLTQKAKEGVKVRLLLDSIGSFSVSERSVLFQELRSAGGEVVFFTPILRNFLNSYINLRNHRKIFLFDGKKVITGGLNLSREYMKESNCWSDIAFMLEGSALKTYNHVFASDWEYATQTKLTYPQRFESYGNIKAQVVPSGPDVETEAMFEALINALYLANKSITIVTPYFIPDDSILQALIIAKNRGVEVELITPRRSNWRIADFARNSYLRELRQKNIPTYLYKQMLHAKIIVIDDNVCMMGSSNIDNRSFFLNYEIVSFFYSRSVIATVHNYINTLKANATTTPRESSALRVYFENAVRVISPQL